jgi:hypothetical protein
MMMGLRRMSGALLVAAALSGLTTLLSCAAAAAEPSTGDCLAAYEDSVRLTKAHQSRAALTKLAMCSADSCPGDIRTECLGRVRETEESIPTVVFQAKDPAGTNLFEVKVKMDGELLEDRLSGSAVSVDPGEHTFTFEAVGRPTVEKKLMILEGEKLRRERVDFEVVTKAAPLVTIPVTVSKSEATTVQSENPREPKPTLGKTRILALVSGGVGVVATGVGVAYGLITKSRRDAANDICPTQCADSGGVEAWNRARSAGNISTGAFVIGAVGIAGGVVIWTLGKRVAPDAPSTQVSVGLGDVRLVGSW